MLLKKNRIFSFLFYFLLPFDNEFINVNCTNISATHQFKEHKNAKYEGKDGKKNEKRKKVISKDDENTKNAKYNLEEIHNNLFIARQDIIHLKKIYYEAKKEAITAEEQLNNFTEQFDIAQKDFEKINDYKKSTENTSYKLSRTSYKKNTTSTIKLLKNKLLKDLSIYEKNMMKAHQELEKAITFYKIKIEAEKKAFQDYNSVIARVDKLEKDETEALLLKYKGDNSFDDVKDESNPANKFFEALSRRYNVSLMIEDEELIEESEKLYAQKHANYENEDKENKYEVQKKDETYSKALSESKKLSELPIEPEVSVIPEEKLKSTLYENSESMDKVKFEKNLESMAKKSPKVLSDLEIDLAPKKNLEKEMNASPEQENELKLNSALKVFSNPNKNLKSEANNKPDSKTDLLNNSSQNFKEKQKTNKPNNDNSPLVKNFREDKKNIYRDKNNAEEVKLTESRLNQNSNSLFYLKTEQKDKLKNNKKIIFEKENEPQNLYENPIENFETVKSDSNQSSHWINKVINCHFEVENGAILYIKKKYMKIKVQNEIEDIDVLFICVAFVLIPIFAACLVYFNIF